MKEKLLCGAVIVGSAISVVTMTYSSIIRIKNILSK